MICVITSPTSNFGSFKDIVNDLTPAMKSGILKQAIVPVIDPPIVMITDGISMKFPIAETPPELMMPNTTMTRPIAIPASDAISNFTHLPC